jgi:hypothetical protein
MKAMASISTEQLLYVDTKLWFILFGLECALGVEFNADVTERLFRQEDSAGDSAEQWLLGIKRFQLYARRGILVTATKEEYEDGYITLSVEAVKPYQPSLAEIVVRASYQVFRMQRWQERDETAN